MRKLNGVVIDKVAPNDPEVLWINLDASTNSSLGIFVCESGVWKDLTQALGARVTSHQNTISTLSSTYAPKSLETTVGNLANDLAGVSGRVSILEAEVFPETNGGNDNTPDEGGE